MPMKIKLDTSKLDAIARNLDVNTDDILNSAAFDVETLAKTMAPVDTGALKNSIETEKKSHGLYWVHDGVEYGVYQELGTYKMAAQPFMVPAVEQVAKNIGDLFKDLFK